MCIRDRASSALLAIALQAQGLESVSYAAVSYTHLLMRPNVLLLDDVGLINGISKCYFSGAVVSRSDAREVALAWEPYRTVAAWYICRSLDPVPVEY